MPPKIISKFRKLLHTPCYEALNNGRTRFPSFQTIDEASLQRLVRQYSQVCSTPYGWKGDGTPCYILLFVSSLGASLETVQLVYNANPTVVSNWSADSGYWKEIFHRAPANVLEFLLNKYPQIVPSPTNPEYDVNILYLVIDFERPPEVVKIVLGAGPHMASTRFKFFTLPFQQAIAKGASLEVLETLLKACPSSGFTVVHGTCTSFQRVWQVVRGEHPSTTTKEWSVLMMMLCYAEHTVGLLDCTFYPLHAAASRCYPDVIKVLIGLNRESVRIPDSSGRLPLALASMSPKTNMCELTDHYDKWGWKDGEPRRDCDESKINLLVREYPEAAAIPDPTGRLPLMHALLARIPAEEGLEALLRAAPHVVEMVDPITGLHPFMVAAVSSPADKPVVEDGIDDPRQLSITYFLLRSYPSIIPPLCFHS